MVVSERGLIIAHQYEPRLWYGDAGDTKGPAPFNITCGLYLPNQGAVSSSATGEATFHTALLLQLNQRVEALFVS